MDKKTEEEIKKGKKYLKKTMKEYSGYKKIENREQSEKAIKKLIINELQTFSDDLKKVHDKAISNYNVLIWEDIDSLLSELEVQILKIKALDYGDTTFFSSPKLKDLNLDYLYVLDAKLVKKLKDLEVEDLDKSIKEEQIKKTKEKIKKITKSIETVKKLYKMREKAIKEYKKVKF